MDSLTKGFRVLSVAMLVCLCAGTARADGTATPAPAAPPPASAAPSTAPGDVVADPSVWQVVITGQIEAFRKGDATTALSFAGAVFKKNFSDPNVFMMSIASAGYTPIFTSVSHTFGKFTQPDPMTALQIVDLVGPKQELLEAIYMLQKEPDGWRVEGVELARTAGTAV